MDYILSSNLFSHAPTSRAVLEKIRENIPLYVSEKRLSHILSVEREALRLSDILFPYLGIDKKYQSDISAAALLHDITKKYTTEEHAGVCSQKNIPVSKYELSRGFTLHAKTGAFAARDIFGINDIVFSAIYCHTTGKEDMNVFDKIIFIADYIEETRTAKECIAAREYFYNNAENTKDKLLLLDLTIIKALKATVSYLLEINSPVECETIDTLNFLLAEYALQKQHTGD